MLRSGVGRGGAGEVNPKGLGLRTQVEVSVESVVQLELGSRGQQGRIWEAPSLRGGWVGGQVRMLPILERPEQGQIRPQ